MNRVKKIIKSEKFQGIWKDPVWSKVISAAILGVISLVITLLVSIWDYLFINSFILKGYRFILSNITELSLLIDSKLTNKYVGFFVKTFIILGILLFISRLIYLRTKNYWSHIFHTDAHSNEEMPYLNSHPLYILDSKIANAFPSIRGLQWFNNPKEATHRLEVLLKKPLRFKRVEENGEWWTDIFWWYRGDGNMYISDFKIVKKSLCLLDDHYELNIDKIAIYRSHKSKLSYIYVETKPLKKTGLYDIDRMEDKIRESGHYEEPYAILGKRIISISDYEDGSTVINGKIVSTQEAKSRLRYVSKYNFIIASQLSPYNSEYFDRNADVYLNGILRGTHTHDELFKFMEKCVSNYDKYRDLHDPYIDLLN